MILNEYGKTAYNCWLEIPQHYQYIVLHEFVIMPNHIHGILEIADVGVEYFRPNNETDNKRVENIRPLQRPNCKSGTIGAIVRGFKIGVTKQIDHSVWQRNYHEHIIRNRDRHAMIVDYINHNPAQWEHDRFYAN
jgi:REP element-mobilizing transposase RayT